MNYNNIRESSFKLFLTSLSTNTTKNNYPYLSDITFNFNSPIQLNNEDDQFIINISDLTLLISWYGFSSYFNNNILYYTINSVSYSYTINEGSYSALDLVSSLTVNLNGLVISFNTINNKFTFTHTTYDFTLNFITSNCY